MIGTRSSSYVIKVPILSLSGSRVQSHRLRPERMMRASVRPKLWHARFCQKHLVSHVASLLDIVVMCHCSWGLVMIFAERAASLRRWCIKLMEFILYKVTTPITMSGRLGSQRLTCICSQGENLLGSGQGRIWNAPWTLKHSACRRCLGLFAKPRCSLQGCP